MRSSLRRSRSTAVGAVSIAERAHPLRLCLDRIAPPRRDRPVTFALPAIETTADLPKASAALLEAVASGELTPSEAAELGKLVEAHVKAIEATQLQARLERLERLTAQ